MTLQKGWRNSRFGRAGDWWWAQAALHCLAAYLTRPAPSLESALRRASILCHSPPNRPAAVMGTLIGGDSGVVWIDGGCCLLDSPSFPAPSCCC